MRRQNMNPQPEISPNAAEPEQLSAFLVVSPYDSKND